MTKKVECCAGYDCDACKGIEGMTLRDWFAGMAMNGLLAANSPMYGMTQENVDQLVAKEAYKSSDAMLRQRNSCHSGDCKDFWVVVSAQGKPLSVHTTKPTDNGFNCIKVREVVE